MSDRGRCGLLPVEGVYTMKAEKAAEVAQMIKPAVAVPIHLALSPGAARMPRSLSVSCRPDQGAIIQGNRGF